MKKLLFLINPYSGKVQIKNELLDILKTMNEAGYETTVWTSQRPKHITELVEQYGTEYDRIVCSGGDGTLHEAVTGLMALPQEQRPPMGYLPSGSTNDVAFGLELPTELQQAAEVTVGDHMVELDIGQFENRFFTYVAAFGAFTEVTYLTPQAEKNLLGHPAYVLEGAKRLSDIRPIHVKVNCDGEMIEDNVMFGMVSNAKSVGGMRNFAGKNVGLDDGLFEMTLVKEPTNPLLDYPAIVTALLARKTEGDSNFYTMKGEHMTFEFDEPISWVLDGEFGGTVQKVEIFNRARAIRVFVP